MPASTESLNELHTAIAKDLTERVVGAELTEQDPETGEVKVVGRIRASAAELAVAVKFLKDNSVFADPSQSDATKGLKDALASRAAGRKPTARDVRDAMRQIGSDLVQ